jgi:acylphosphatase
MITKRYIIKGRVQGVGFRYFVYRKALQLSVKGYVKNLPNGDVEIEAEASERNIEEFEKYLWKGPVLSNVVEIKITEIPTTSYYLSFDIKY